MQQRLNEVFGKILKEREGYVEAYIASLEQNGSKNQEAINLFGLIADSDRHLQNLEILGADHGKLPVPLPRS